MYHAYHFPRKLKLNPLADGCFLNTNRVHFQNLLPLYSKLPQ